MRYFTFGAKHAFITSASGQRLFYRGGPWTRPFVVPNADIEKRLYTKHVWMLRIQIGGLLLGQPFLFMQYPEVTHQPFWFLACLVIVTAVFEVVGRIVFARDTKALQRSPDRPGLRLYYGQMAGHHSELGLILRLVGSLLFVAIGVRMLCTGANWVIAVVGIGFFGLCALAWGYVFSLKSKI